MRAMLTASSLLVAAKTVLAASVSAQVCRACHAMDSKLVEPSFRAHFRDIAAFYGNDGHALAQLQRVCRKVVQGDGEVCPCGSTLALARPRRSNSPTGP